MKVTVKAPAKINLTLEITGRLPNGYHTVEMVMQAIDLTDTVSVQPGGNGLSLTLSDPTLPVDEHNTVYKAAKLYCEAAGIRPDFRLEVTKNIPMQAGLAGGSADAAATLVALNTLCDHRLSLEQLLEIGAAVGADVPFCLVGGTKLATGIGTTLSPLPAMPDGFIVVLKPAVGVSTAEAYRAVDAKTFERKTAEKMCRALESGNLAAVGREMYNRFAEAMPITDVETLVSRLEELGALGACMTGSGSAVVGLFDTESAAKTAEQALKSLCQQTAVCSPCSTGPIVV